MNNSFGDFFKVTTFGESHGNSIGCVIDGCPAGIIINFKKIQILLNKRKPGISKYVTQRSEFDKLEILSGIYKGKTTGSPISFIVRNKSFISKDYKNIKNFFRPGHADLTYFMKYNIRDYRGGGRSSARTTISIVIAGSIAKYILEEYFNIRVFCFLKKIGNFKIPLSSLNEYKMNSFFCPNMSFLKKIKKKISLSIKKNDSLSCVVSLLINGIIPGLGDPLFNKFDSNLIKAIFDINAVKSLRFGKIRIKGSINNDSFFKEGFLSNNSGGCLGGITTGQDINLDIYFKPTSSIFKSQKSLDKKFNLNEIKIKGRHDPCVGLRSSPIIESISSIIILDSIIKNKLVSFF